MLSYAKCSKNIVIVKKKVQKYGIWNQTIQNVCFLAQTFNKYGISTETLEKYLILAQNIRKVLNWYEYYSKSIAFVNKTFGNNVILAPKHLKSIHFWPRLFKKYRNSTPNIRKVSYFYPKHGKWYRILYPKHLKVSYIDLKYLELSWSRLQEVWGIVQCFDPNCFKQISYGRMF